MPTTIRPFLMFQDGNAEEAMNFYISLFPGARINDITRYGPGEAGPEGTVMKASFTIADQAVICIDSPVRHAFSFTPSFSLFVDCMSETEIDTLTATLSEGGKVLMPLDNYGFSRRFTWVNDRYGVSWQINLP